MVRAPAVACLLVFALAAACGDSTDGGGGSGGGLPAGGSGGSAGSGGSGGSGGDEDGALVQGDLPGPVSLALVDGAALIGSAPLTASGSLLQVALPGGGAPSTIATGVAPLLLVAGDPVVFASRSEVFTVSAAGGTATSIHEASGLDSITGLAVDGGTVFVAEGDLSDCDHGRILSLPVTGGTPTPLADASCPTALRLAGGLLYFAMDSSVVASVPVAGGTPAPLYTGTGDVTDLAVGASSIYAHETRDPVGGKVVEIPLAGGAGTVLTEALPGAPSPLSRVVLLSDSHVYWASGGLVGRVPRAGGDSQTLASGSGLVVNFALGETDVYYLRVGALRVGNGQLRRVAR